MSCLLFTVHFLDGRFHGLEPDGRPEWPPSPARLFQALVAAAARGATLAEEDKLALEWIERLDPPLIAAPARHKGQSFSHFMPNNDMDTIGGDPARISEIRSATKRFHPQIFDHETPFLYVWPFDDGRDHAERLREIATRLYQLGRGVDMAWATAEVLEDEEARARLNAHPGVIHRPANGGAGRSLACPIPGSLPSLIVRYEKSRARFKPVIEAAPTKMEPSRKKVAGQTFAQPPKPRFDRRPYDSPPSRHLYELSELGKDASLVSWPLAETVRLVETVRNEAADRLKKSLPDKTAIIDRVFGLCRDATEADKAYRIRIVPLPSIGHPHADQGIRRLLVEIPADCPLAAKDIEWAFSAAGAIDRATGEIQWMLDPAEEHDMLGHYGIGENEQNGFRIWRTVTPMALPVGRPHGRKNGAERAAIECEASSAVVQALRHSGISTRPESIRVQREPFDRKGLRAERFASGSRFPSARLWHVEIAFGRPLPGMMVAGDGRYLGLGLFRPVRQVTGVLAFDVIGESPMEGDPSTYTRVMRRAVMSLVQEQLGPRTALPAFFTGHEKDGSPLRRGGRLHLACAYDNAKRRLLIIAPHLLERRPLLPDEHENLGLLQASVQRLRRLYAGDAVQLELRPTVIDSVRDHCFGAARTWMTLTEYRPTRHAKKLPEEAVMADVETELHRRHFPSPERIEILSITRGPRGGLRASLKLEFKVAVQGPLLLGQSSNFGHGLFVHS